MGWKLGMDQYHPAAFDPPSLVAAGIRRVDLRRLVAVGPDREVDPPVAPAELIPPARRRTVRHPSLPSSIRSVWPKQLDEAVAESHNPLSSV